MIEETQETVEEVAPVEPEPLAYFYSASAKGFYANHIHGENMPTDVVPVAEEVYVSLLAAQGNGKMIVPDANGVPTLVDYTPSPEESSANLVSAAKAALDATDTVFVRCGKAGVAWPSAWQNYVVALRKVVAESSTSLPKQPAYPQGT